MRFPLPAVVCALLACATGVRCLAQGPTITVPPQDVQVTAGQPATFSVTAMGNGGALTYQWRRGGYAIPGATNASFTLPAASRSDADAYDVVVSDPSDNRASGHARLMVAPISYPGLVTFSRATDFQLTNTRSTGLGHNISAFAHGPEGTLYVAGHFTHVNGQPVNGNVIRLRSDGVIDPTFSVAETANPNPATAICVQGDGKILVGSLFASTDDALVRLNTNGSRDMSFQPHVADNELAGVSAIVIQPDGRILVGGSFNAVAGQQRRGLARLDRTGTLDAGFDAAMQGSVWALALERDSAILVGGVFSAAGGLARNALARLRSDGSADAAFAPGFVSGNSISAIALAPDGKIVVGGSFPSVGGNGGAGAAQLLPDGSRDAGFDIGLGFNTAVGTILRQEDGRVIAGGGFSNFSAQAGTSRLIRLTSSGGRDISFRFFPGEGSFQYINCIALTDDGSLWVGGSEAGGYSLARLVAAGAPPNDAFGAAQALPGNSGSVTGSNVLATGETGEPVHINTNGTATSVWYRWTPASSGKAQVDTIGSNFDTVIAVYTGATLGSLVKVGEDDQSGGGDTSKLLFNAVAGTTYYIAVGDWSSERLGGNILLNYQIIVPPIIAAQPVSQVAVAGGSATFTVTATGTGLGYQWLRNGAFIAGATNATLTLGNVQVSDAGSYAVVVTNPAGAVTSTGVTLSGANPPPSIVAQPQSQQVTAGQPATFSVTATGSGGALSYQWRRGGYAIPGATNATFTLPAASRSDAFAYEVSVAEGLSVSPSQLAFLSVAPRNYPGVVTFERTSAAFVENAGTGYVQCLAYQSDGNILLGGDFVGLDGVRRSRLARLNADGTLDPGFLPPALGQAVESISVLPSGKILVGGWFGTSGMLGLNAGGSVDPAFPQFNSTVYAIARQPDGKIVVAGWFRTVNGQARSRIARLGSDGSLDASFVGPEINSVVSRIAVLGDGRILIAGDFSVVGGVARSRLSRLNADGSLDAAFNPAPNSTVRSLVAQSDGRVLVGGWFSNIAGQSRSYLARLNGDGSLDGTFAPILNGAVESILVEPDGKLVIGGQFSAIDSQTRRRVARLDASGALQTTLSSGANSAVFAVARAENGALVFGGSFISFADQPRARLARLLPDGSLDSGLAPVLRGAGTIATFAAGPEGTIFVGGDFTHLNGQSVAGRVARLNADGTLATGFGLPSTLNVGPTAALRLQGDGKLLVGYQSSNVSAGSLLRFDAAGVRDTSFDPQVGWFDGTGVRALVLDSQGRVLIGGTFTALAGQPRRGVGRLDRSGQLDSVFDAGLNGNVSALALQPDGAIVAGGSFTSAGGQTRTAIARLRPDGASDVGFASGFAAGNSIAAVALEPDGKLVVGGNFTAVGGTARDRAARLLADGALDPAFDIGGGFNSSVETVLRQEDGRLLFAGGFSTFNFQSTASRLTRLTSTGTRDPTFRFVAGNGAFSTITAVHLADDGTLWIGGSEASGYSLARLVAVPPPANDAFAAAQVLSGISGSVTSSNVLATGEAGEPVHINANGTATSVWYRWTPASSGKAQIDTIGSNFNTVIAVYTGATLGSLVKVGEDNQSGGGDTSKLLFNAVAGTTYYIAVGDSSSDRLGGNILLNYTLVPLPVIVAQPETQTASVGGGATISVSATGTGLAYQWFRNGLAIAGATGSQLSLSNLQISDAGRYWVTITNAGGVVGSTEVSLTGAQPPPTIVSQPADVSFTSGQDASLAVTATGTGQLAYQWRRRGLPIPGATQAGLALPAIERAAADFYDVVVYDGLSFAESRTVAVAVAPTAYPTAVTWDPVWSRRAELPGSPSGQLVLPLDDGKAYLAGIFVAAGGFSRTGIMRALASGALDTTFAPPELIGDVRSLALQSDGKLLVGGSFTRVAGQKKGRLIRLNADGSIDASFGARIENGTVVCIAVLTDGRIIAGGSFNSVEGEARPALVRLQANGTLDRSYLPEGLSWPAAALLTRSDGSVLVGLNPGGALIPDAEAPEQRYLVRVDATGVLDASFAPTFNGAVMALARMQDGGVLAGGAFTKAGGTAVGRISRLTEAGTFDPVFAANTGIGFDLEVNSLAVQDDGRILAGGSFFFYQNLSGGELLRLNVDGTHDNSFQTRSFSGTVNAVGLRGEKIDVAGNFGSHETTNGARTDRPGFARLNADGTVDTAFVPPAFRIEGALNTFVAASERKTLAAGGFSHLSGVPVSANMIRLTSAGAVDATFNPGGAGFDGSVASLARQGDGKILAGGGVRRFNGTSFSPSLARLLPAGMLDVGFGNGGSGTSSLDVVSVRPDGRIFVAGRFSTVHGIGRRNVAMLMVDGSVDPGFEAVGGMDEFATFYVSAAAPDGKVLLGGWIFLFAGTSPGHIVRMLPTGALDATFNPGGAGANSNVHDIALLPDGRILICGDFTSYNGVTRNRVARLLADGTLDPAFVPPAIPSFVSALLPQADGRVLIGGWFSNIGGAPNTGYLARLNADGSLDTSFLSEGLTRVTSSTMVMRDDGQIIFGSDGYTCATRPASIPTIAEQPQNRTAAAGSAVTFSVSAAGVPEVTYQWRKNGALLPGATGATLTLSAVQGSHAGVYDVVVNNGVGGPVISAAATLVVDGASGPTFTGQPASVSIDAGAAATFFVSVAGVPAPTLRWQMSDNAGEIWTDLADTPPYIGVTTAQLTIAAITTALHGLRFRCAATNDSGVVYSSSATLNVIPAGMQARHGAAWSGYLAGSQIVVRNEVIYPGSAGGLTCQVLLPEGWRFVGDTLGSAGVTRPVPDQAGLLEWVWPAGSVPPSPVRFAYTLRVPSGETAERELVLLVLVGAGADPYTVLARPDPLGLSPLVWHTADSNRDRRIDLSELTRVIELYNTRHGTVRTGAYKLQALTEDGFAPDPERGAGVVVPLVRAHSADTSNGEAGTLRDGRIELLELTRVIELYNFRAGTSRTGAYRVEAGTEDGFAAGP